MNNNSSNVLVYTLAAIVIALVAFGVYLTVKNNGEYRDVYTDTSEYKEPNEDVTKGEVKENTEETASSYFTQELKYGMEDNAEVTLLQRFLIANGYLNGSPNGDFYTFTQAAVKKYQANRGLPQTGIVDAATRDALNDAIGNGASLGVPGPVLTQAQAEALVLSSWGGCGQDICTSLRVTVSQDATDRYIVTATYNGLYDDSTSASRKVAIATFANGTWTLGVSTNIQSCHRGHVDGSLGFTSALCI